MKRLYKLLLCGVFLFLVCSVSKVHAQGAGEVDQKIAELQAKIAELQGQENTLGKQLVLLNTNIALSMARIESTSRAIEKLSIEIVEFAQDIDRLEKLLTQRSKMLLRHIPQTYKRQVAPQFGSLFLSKDFSDIVAHIHYLATIQEWETQMLFQLKAAQQSFGEKKTIRESKKAQQILLQKQLEIEKQDLDRQRKSKQILLDQTKSNEAAYQQLLAQALAEKQALEKALTDSVKVGPVNKGDPIALVGNTGYPGCSTGAHLHFEVRRGGQWVNAEEYLSGRSVYDDQIGGNANIGSGSWDWPLEGTIYVTQHYGKTPYSWRYGYSGGIHTGVDMISKTSTIIRAPHAGTLYSSSQSCGGASIIKIKYIDHGDGLTSFYLHVQ